MVLSLDNNNKDISTTTTSALMTRDSIITKKKSLDHQLTSPTKKRSSLLVDYSKRKANVNNVPLKKELFGGGGVVPAGSRSPVDTIEDALSLASSASLHSHRHNDPSSTPEEINTNDESFSLLDNNDEHNQLERRVSFRVRKNSIRRSKSMDERKISSYDHLQNSIRSTLLMQEEDEEPEENDNADNTPNKRSSMPTTMPTTTTTTISIDRRAQLANVRKKHQSMRSLHASGEGKSGSMRNLMLTSTTAACSPASTAPTSTTAKLSPTPSIPRPTKNKKTTSATTTSMLSKSLHGEGSSSSLSPVPSTSTSASTSSRRASLLNSKRQCRSCRHLMRRSKSLQHESSNSTLNMSIGMLNGGGIEPPSQSSSHNSPIRVRRSSTLGGNPAVTGNKRGSLLSVMRSQTMSRRNLLDASMHNMNDESSCMNDSSTLFFAAAGRSRIRRLNDTN